MKAMLAAINCQKGKIKHNLKSHLHLIAQAVSEQCDIVVFPEMSLTGYIDPRNPQHQVLSINSEVVNRLTDASRENRIGILFGMAETNPDGAPFIAQVAIDKGEITAVYRKRHLADNETDLFTAGKDSVIGFNGDDEYGIAVCADRDFPDEFEFASESGARIVFHPSAPGLHPPRRTTDETWRQGFNWWRDTCLEIHGKRARELGIAIAVVSQAGSTEDEDFPGWAGLIGADGELKSELPDWKVGNLIVEV